MGGEKSVKVLVLVGAALLALSLPRMANADDAPALAMCKAISDRAAELIRNGELDRASRSKRDLEKCVALQRAALNRETQRVVDSAKR
jgi:hypothetical protein